MAEMSELSSGVVMTPKTLALSAARRLVRLIELDAPSILIDREVELIRVRLQSMRATPPT
jgi:hypothetical protein